MPVKDSEEDVYHDLWLQSIITLLEAFPQQETVWLMMSILALALLLKTYSSRSSYPSHRLPRRCNLAPTRHAELYRTDSPLRPVPYRLGGVRVLLLQQLQHSQRARESPSHRVFSEGLRRCSIRHRPSLTAIRLLPNLANRAPATPWQARDSRTTKRRHRRLPRCHDGLRKR